MALSFALSADIQISVWVTCDKSVSCDEEARSTYLSTGDLSGVSIGDDATEFIIKPLSAHEREQTEINAGAHTRSELGMFLSNQKPSDLEDRARWHDALTLDERSALAQYDQYLSRCYDELVRSSLIEIVGAEGSPFEIIQSIRPENHRQLAIIELVCHIQRLSLLGDKKKEI